MISAEATPTGSKAKQTKLLVRALLERRDTSAIISWAQSDRNPLRTLSSLLFEENPLVAWRAIEAIGQVAGTVSNTDIDKVKRQIRKLLWMMNDESGGLCRRGPEAIGEILINVPSLTQDYAHLLPPYLWEEPFEVGTRSAIFRLLSARPETTDIFQGCIGDLLKSLDHPDEIMRGYSLLVLKTLHASPKAPDIDIPKIAPCTIPFYDFGSGDLDTIEISA